MGPPASIAIICGSAKLNVLSQMVGQFSILILHMWVHPTVKLYIALIFLKNNTPLFK